MPVHRGLRALEEARELVADSAPDMDLLPDWQPTRRFRFLAWGKHPSGAGFPSGRFPTASRAAGDTRAAGTR